MEERVSWHVHLAVKPGQLESFRSLNDEMVESTREETGVLVYERFINEDGTEVQVYERYSDSRTAVAHLQSFRNKYGERFSELVDRKAFTVFGTPSHELRILLNEFAATFASPLAGFSRC